MKQLKHTLEPWEVYMYTPLNLDVSYHFIAVIKRKGIIDNNNPEIIISFKEINNITKNICNLIASAPEMLESLIEVTKFENYDYENFKYFVGHIVKPLVEKFYKNGD